MSLITADGFDHYGSFANVLGDVGFSGANLTAANFFLSTVNPRTGTYCLRGGPGGASQAEFILGTTMLETIVGFAFDPDAVPSTSRLIDFQDGNFKNNIVVEADGAGIVHIYYQPNQAVARILVASSTGQVIFPGTYQYIEVQCLIDPVAGYVEVRREGVTVATYTGQTNNTDGNGNNAIVQVFGYSGGNVIDVDDFYAINVDGTAPDNFLGPVKCRTEFPNADTADADWALNGAGTGFGCIDNVPQLMGTDFLDATAAGNLSMFDMSDLPVTVSSIAAVCVFSFQEKSDAGMCETRTEMKSSGATALGNVNSISTGPGYERDIYPKDPNTGSAWTRAGFNAAQVGILRVS